jgi:hypothetical protein
MMSGLADSVLSGQSRNRHVADVVAAGNLSDWLALVVAPTCIPPSLLGVTGWPGRE